MKQFSKRLSAIIFAAALLSSCSGADTNTTAATTTAHTHSFGEWKTAVAATCDKAGSQERSCSCGESETRPLDQLEHSMIAGICTLCGYIDDVKLLEFATMQLVTLQPLPDGTYSVKSNDLGTTAKQLAIPAEYEGKKITAIADGAFEWNENLTSITLPDSITKIGKGAFESCTALRTVNLPDGVNEIGARAFYNCKKLTKLEIPVGTGSIGYEALTYTGLTSLTVAKGNLIYHSENNALIHTESKTLIRATKKTDEIPADGSVSVIDSGAFYGLWGISELSVPEGVTEIGSNAFHSCGDLTKLTLPSTLTKVGSHFTAGAQDGETLHIYYNGTLSQWDQLVGNLSWYDTDGYRILLHGSDESLHLRHDPKPTGTYTEEATCTQNGTEIYSCVCGITQTVAVPELGHSYYAAECTRCGEHAPDGHFLEYELLPDGTWAVTGNGNWIKDKVLVIPATYQGKAVTVVKKDAFDYDSTYIGLIIEEGVKILEEGAFRNCTGFTFAELPKSITSIGSFAFASCRELTTFTLNNGITEIGENTFSGCSKLQSINIPSTVKKIGYAAFRGCSSLASITLPNGLTEIGANAFASCKALTQLIIPDSVTTIGNAAFSHCEKLESITLPRTLANISEDMLSWCESLKTLTIPETVSVITGEYVFYNTAISELIIENPNIRIDSVSFNGMSKLKSIRFSGTLAQWAQVGSSFASCYSATVTVYCTDGNAEFKM